MRIAGLFTAITATLAIAGAGCSGDGEPASKQRQVISCSEAIEMLRTKGSLTLTPGDWGPTPSQARMLPPGAELCGGSTPTFSSATFPVHDTWVKSELDGPALDEFYKPISTALGCSQSFGRDTEDKVWLLGMNCPNSTQIIIAPAPDHQIYTISTRGL